MESDTVDMMHRTVPESLQNEVSCVIESARVKEEEKLKQESSRFARQDKCYGNHVGQNQNHESDRLLESKQQAEKTAMRIAIAVLITQVWSPKMRKHVENLILNKAIQENYLESKLKKFVCILDDKDELKENDWVIEDQDDIIIDMIWNRFNMKEHFHHVRTHRLWVQRSYDKLKDFMPALCLEIIERHDLTKFAFSQAVGYTLKFVHNTYHDIWRSACDFHLHNEPHHPQTWSKIYTPEEKYQKLELWIRCTDEIQNGFAYGINLTPNDLISENFPEVFLLESFLDMVAIEWERKKGQRLDITTTDLVYMEDRFLRRYTLSQHFIINELINKVKGLDESWKDVKLTEREQNLLSLVCEQDKPCFVSKLVSQKKIELARLLQHARASENSFTGGGDSDQEKVDDEIQKRANDQAYFIMVATVVMEFWNSKFRKNVEELVLQKAIEEQFIKESHLQWIFVIENREKPMEEESGEEMANIPVVEDDLVKMIWEDFNVREHFSQMKDHRNWVMQSYHRLSKYMPEVPKEVIERHDLSKFAFSQAIGYTLKWVHNIQNPIWKKACDFHLHGEPHHPEMWSRVHYPGYKKSCLESWLCLQGGGSRYGVDVSSLNLKSENMAKVFLLESFLDMVGIEWERKKEGRLDLTNTQLIQMENKYLFRYCKSDREIMMKLMTVIREDDRKFQ